MTLSDDQADDMLQALVLGDVDASSPRAREAFLQDPALQERFEEHLRLEQSIRSAAKLEKEILEEALAEGEGDSRQATVRSLLASRPPRPRASARPSGPLVRFAVYAAAVLIVVAPVAIIMWRSETTAPHGVPMGSAVKLLQPVGQTQQFAEFRWTHPLPPGGFYRVRVRTPNQGVDSSDLAVSPPLEDAFWRPSITLHWSWPDSIEWVVEVHDGTTVVATGTGSASRSP